MSGLVLQNPAIHPQPFAGTIPLADKPIPQSRKSQSCISTETGESLRKNIIDSTFHVRPGSSSSVSQGQISTSVASRGSFRRVSIRQVLHQSALSNFHEAILSMDHFRHGPGLQLVTMVKLRRSRSGNARHNLQVYAPTQQPTRPVLGMELRKRPLQQSRAHARPLLGAPSVAKTTARQLNRSKEHKLLHLSAQNSMKTGQLLLSQLRSHLQSFPLLVPVYWQLVPPAVVPSLASQRVQRRHPLAPAGLVVEVSSALDTIAYPHIQDIPRGIKLLTIQTRADTRPLQRPSIPAAQQNHRL